jgi:hypothetical protein
MLLRARACYVLVVVQMIQRQLYRFVSELHYTLMCVLFLDDGTSVWYILAKVGEYYNLRLEVKYSSIQWTDWNTSIPTHSTS